MSHVPTFMPVTPKVVHNFPKALCVKDFCPLCKNKIPGSYAKSAGGNNRNCSPVSTINATVLPQDDVGHQLSELYIKCLLKYVNLKLQISLQSDDKTVFFFNIEKSYEPIGFIRTPSAVTHLGWSPSSHVSRIYISFTCYYSEVKFSLI